MKTHHFSALFCLLVAALTASKFHCKAEASASPNPDWPIEVPAKGTTWRIIK